jgi:hypothetical protein
MFTRQIWITEGRDGKLRIFAEIGVRETGRRQGR